MKKYLVKNYMRDKVVTLNPTDTVKHAVEVMLNHKTNGLVVIDDSRHVLGILSSWDVIAYLVPDYLENDKHLASFEAGDVFEERVKEIQNDSVSKFMSSHVHTTRPEHSLIEAATLLSEFQIRQLPVVDENGILVGYLNRTDIKKAIGDVLHLS
ncbi:CBS domain-containing protein [Candidatus Peregrinibacteria bacterium]|nr:MAG: CBS domain-containing protein [Candidatus Peregrinibacteria bacterium]